MFCNYDDLRIINIEHIFYLCVLFLSAVSILNFSIGKNFLYLICFLFLSHIYLIPEMEEITILESCNEGKCEQAINQGMVKIDNHTIIYIPKNER